MTRSLPLIDLAGWTDGDPADRRAVADRIGAACRHNGFFTVVGHGIPAQAADTVIAQARRLFALDAGAKQTVGAVSAGGRGYARMGGRALDGRPHAPVKEEFYLGRDRPAGDPAANVWPSGLPGFRETMLSHVEAMHRLAETLMAVIARSLELPDQFFAAFCAEPIAALRLVRYPPEGAEAGEHTDFGALTILLQDGAGGLQVLDRATGDWTDATPVTGGFVVNLGDLMERWTNRRYRSTPHRVVHPAGVERISAPFFLTGAADHPVVCAPSCLANGEQPLYPPTTPAAYLHARMRAQGF